MGRLAPLGCRKALHVHCQVVMEAAEMLQNFVAQKFLVCSWRSATGLREGQKPRSLRTSLHSVLSTYVFPQHTPSEHFQGTGIGVPSVRTLQQCHDFSYCSHRLEQTGYKEATHQPFQEQPGSAKSRMLPIISLQLCWKADLN